MGNHISFHYLYICIHKNTNILKIKGYIKVKILTIAHWKIHIDQPLIWILRRTCPSQFLCWLWPSLKMFLFYIYNFYSACLPAAPFVSTLSSSKEVILKIWQILQKIWQFLEHLPFVRSHNLLFNSNKSL